MEEEDGYTKQELHVVTRENDKFVYRSLTPCYLGTLYEFDTRCHLSISAQRNCTGCQRAMSGMANGEEWRTDERMRAWCMPCLEARPPIHITRFADAKEPRTITKLLASIREHPDFDALNKHALLLMGEEDGLGLWKRDTYANQCTRKIWRFLYHGTT